MTIDKGLHHKFYEQFRRKGHRNRSDAIRSLISDDLQTTEWQSNQETVGNILLVYNHYTSDLVETLAHIQYSFVGDIISVLKVHLDNEHSMDIIVAKGKANLLQSLVNQLASTRGVIYGKLTVVTEDILSSTI